MTKANSLFPLFCFAAFPVCVLAQPKLVPFGQQQALRFEPNRGQASSEARYLARGGDQAIAITPSGIALTLSEQSEVRMEVVGGRVGVLAEPEEKLPGVVNYYLGNDPKHWQVGVPTYGRLRLREVYPGIDLVYYGDGANLEYDFVVKPEADPGQIRLRYAGMDSMKVNAEGDLILRAGGEELRQKRPLIYQERGGKKIVVAGGYRVFEGTSDVRVALAAYDHRRALVIDPTIVFSRSLGASGNSSGLDIAVDAQGASYITGVVDPILATLNAAQGTFGGGAVDAFVVKLNADGSVAYATYLGGAQNDSGLSISTFQGSAYVAGQTFSQFPSVNPTQPCSEAGDAFVARLGPTGALNFSTCLGGATQDATRGIAVDSQGAMFVTGSTEVGQCAPPCGSFPTKNAAQPLPGGYQFDAFLTKFSAGGSVEFSTYLGGPSTDVGYDVGVDAAGNAYIAGTSSGGIPLGLNNSNFVDGFVTKFSGNGQILYTRYIGGPGHEEARGLAVTQAGIVYVTGFTSGSIGPNGNAAAGFFTNGVQNVFGGNGAGYLTDDVFVARLDSSGTVSYLTFLGGHERDIAYSIAADSTGAAYITGGTGSRFPVLEALQSTNYHQSIDFQQLFDVFVTKLSPTGQISYSTLLGGGNNQTGFGVAVDPTGAAYVTGRAASNFAPPLPNIGGNFVFKLSPYNSNSTARLTSISPDSATVGAASFSLNLVGSGFQTGAVVRWNGTPLALEGAVRPDAIRVNVPATLLTVPAALTISVTNPGQNASDALVFVVAFNGTGPQPPNLLSASPRFAWNESTGLITSRTVYVTGTGIQPGAALSWNGTALATTNVPGVPGAAAVEATLPGSVTAGPAALTLVNPGTNAASAVSLPLTLTVPPLPVLTSLLPNKAIANTTVNLTASGSTLSASDTAWLWGANSGSPSTITSANGAQLQTTLSSLPSAGTYQFWVAKSVAGAGPGSSASYASNQLPLSVLPAGSCVYSINPPTASFGGAGGAGGFALSTPSYCRWGVVNSSAPWITFPALTGQGNATVAYNVAPNLSANARSATVTIDGQPHTITQAGQGCLFGLTPTSASLPAAAGTASLALTVSGVDCSWTAVSNSPWLTLANPASGIGNRTINYSYQAITSTSGRTGSISVGGLDFGVSQAGTACRYALGQPSQSFVASGGTGVAPINAVVGCPWTAASDAPWLTVSTGAIGNGNGAVPYVVAPNPEASSRTGTLTIGGRAYLVTQAGAASTGCTASAGVPPTLASEGLTEQLGRLDLRCIGVTGSADVTLFVNAVITNSLTGILTDAEIAVPNGSPIRGQLVGPNQIRWTNVPLGNLSLQNIRVNTSSSTVPFQIRGTVSISGRTVANGEQVLGQLKPGLLVQRSDANPPAGGAVTIVPMLVREGFGTAFRDGSRVLLAVANLPAGVQIYAPVHPTQGAQRARLVSADALGSGGAPLAGAPLAAGLYEQLTVTAGQTSATWEILSPDGENVDALQFPLLILNANAAQLNALTLTGSLGPVSGVGSASSTAPVPRFVQGRPAPERLASLRVVTELTQAASSSSAKPSAGRALFGPGANFTLQSQIVNETLETPANQVRIQGNLPSGLLLRSCTLSCTQTGNVIEAVVPTLAPGATATLNAEVTVAATATPGDVLDYWINLNATEVNYDVAATTASVGFRVDPGTAGSCGNNYTVNPAGPIAVAATGATGSTVAVTAAAGCTWSALSNAPWVTVTAGVLGAGSGVVTFTVAPNSGNFSRSTTLSVAGRIIPINQAGVPPPSVTESGPIAGAGAAKTFTFRFSHPSGFQNLGVLNVLMNRALDGGRACYIAYSQPAGVLFLVNDNGPESGLSAPLVLGSAANVSNGQCQINGTGSSAVGSGNSLTLTLNIAFRSAFAGSQVVYLAARDQGSGNSGWSTQGFHEVPGVAVTYPNVISMVPASGTAASSTVALTYEDQSSSTNLQTVWALFNTALDAANACYVAYYAPGNILFLFPDNGDAAGLTNVVLGGTGSVENSRCRINAQGSGAVRSGARLTLNLNLTLKPAFAGSKAVWLALQTLSSVTSPWKVAGAWQVPP